jgi:hypothetical protein
MGLMANVRCRRCGFNVTGLHGLGGDFGFSGDVVLTVVCPTRGGKLADVTVPDLNVARGDTVPPLDAKWPPTAPCPTKGCRAKNHAPWDPETGVCPSCGEPGCEIEPAGCWD